MIRRVTVLALLCAVASALALGACGDDGGAERAVAPVAVKSSPPGEGAVDAILARSFGEDAVSPQSGRIDASLRVRGRGVGALRGPLAIELGGPFDASRSGQVPRLDIESTIDTRRGEKVRSGAISTGRSGYFVTKGRTYEMPSELYGLLRDGLKDAKGGGAPTLGSLGVDPRRWIVDARRVGVERVDGVRAIQITGRLDVPALLADVDALLGEAGQIGLLLPGHAMAQLSPADRQRIAESVRGSEVNLWTGAEDRILRRLEVGVDMADQGALDLRLDLSDVGEPQRIEAPRGARPFSELITGALGGLLDDRGAGAEALRCLQDGGGDPAALQRCALGLAPAGP